MIFGVEKISFRLSDGKRVYWNSCPQMLIRNKFQEISTSCGGYFERSKCSYAKLYFDTRTLEDFDGLVQDQPRLKSFYENNKQKVKELVSLLSNKDATTLFLDYKNNSRVEIELPWEGTAYNKCMKINSSEKETIIEFDSEL